jgi:superfamily II DNA or RNA helicase
MKIIISNKTHILGAGPHILDELQNRLTMTNPAFVDAQRMGRWTGGVDSLLFFYEQPGPGRLVLPRGYAAQLVELCRARGVPYELEDLTRILSPVSFEFKGMLRPYQQKAVTAALGRRFGVIQAPTGSGKTIMGLSIIAERQQPALIVVHSRELLNQWTDRIETFLGIPRAEIGQIGGGVMRIGAKVTVGMVQTLYKCAEDVFEYMGHIIVDECHRCPSRTFTAAVSAFDSRYMLGLSATPYRRDRLTKVIYFYLGDRVAEIGQDELTRTGAILPFRVKWVETAFDTMLDASNDYSRVLCELTEDAGRNALICSETARQARNGGGISLILSDRKAHCERLRAILGRDYGIKATVLTGALGKRERERVVSELHAGRCKVLIATGQLIGEGFDLPELGTVILGTPIRFHGRVIQSIGRALRPFDGQTEALVVDFLDGRVGVLAASARRRAAVYEGLGGKV